MGFQKGGVMFYLKTAYLVLTMNSEN